MAKAEADQSLILNATRITDLLEIEKILGLFEFDNFYYLDFNSDQPQLNNSLKNFLDQLGPASIDQQARKFGLSSQIRRLYLKEYSEIIDFYNWIKIEDFDLDSLTDLVRILDPNQKEAYLPEIIVRWAAFQRDQIKQFSSIKLFQAFDKYLKEKYSDNPNLADLLEPQKLSWRRGQTPWIPLIDFKMNFDQTLPREINHIFESRDYRDHPAVLNIVGDDSRGYLREQANSLFRVAAFEELETTLEKEGLTLGQDQIPDQLYPLIETNLKTRLICERKLLNRIAVNQLKETVDDFQSFSPNESFKQIYVQERLKAGLNYSPLIAGGWS